MLVTFTKTGPRRYRISVEGPGVISSWMEPAPGYDDLLPHDVAHFVVENAMGITGGVFGQLAAGGTAGTFHPFDETLRRKLARRGKQIAGENKKDALLSEKVVAIACGKWMKDTLAGSDPATIGDEDIARICSVFDEVSSIWSKLPIGGSMTLEWENGTKQGRRRLR